MFNVADALVMFGVFQSPSLRGSGRFRSARSRKRRRGGKFQSPSLRGSGRFLFVFLLRHWVYPGFNPLHCGAVVASFCLLSSFSLQLALFQSPSLRGSGRFQHAALQALAAACFNPLHCGAVVAS